jgi:hypothetical protein
MVAPEPVTASASRAGSGWRPGDWWSTGVRVLLLLMLAVGAATAVASLRPAERHEADLIADLSAGRVTYLEYEGSDRRVRWMDGWWRWRQTKLLSWNANGAGGSSADQPQGDAALEWLNRQIDASGHPVGLRFREVREPGWWLNRVEWGPLRTATLAAWVVTFLLMLGRSRHRYANRWAWFWLFTFGQAGALLYLVLEPQPIWRPRSWPPRTGRAPVRGGTGLIWSILLSIAVGLVVAGILAL